MSQKIFVVDDHPIMRRGYASILDRQPDLEVCGEAGSADEALEKIPDSEADLVIVDISMEGMSGIELIKSLDAWDIDLPCLVVSMHDETLYAERALHAGAKGYIMKNEIDQTVVEAVRKILNGGFFLSDQMNNKILQRVSGTQRGIDESPLEQLSDRELEVFELLGKGQSTKEIAEELVISPKTVETHRRRIKQKLGIDSSTELLQRAVLWLEKEASS